MAIIEGQVETIKKLKGSLNAHGITRFNSTGDIDRFLQNYELEKKAILTKIESNVTAEIDDMQSTLLRYQKNYGLLLIKNQNHIEQDIQRLEKTIAQKRQKSEKSVFFKILYYFRIEQLRSTMLKLQKNKDTIVKRKTKPEENAIDNLKRSINYFLSHREDIIAERSNKSVEELSFTKKIIDELYPLIAGAIGENSVVKTIQQLSDDWYLINDFSIKFDPPLYNKKENDRIHSIQIDHLLIGQSGIFLLETKNWSKSSLENVDLRSPVKQILRTSYALFVLLNSDSKYGDIKLERHHWGAKKIPIKNIIVFTNKKPKEEFKHVKILSISELIGYIKYFDASLHPGEVKRIFEYLKKTMQKGLY